MRISPQNLQFSLHLLEFMTCVASELRAADSSRASRITSDFEYRHWCSRVSVIISEIACIDAFNS